MIPPPGPVRYDNAAGAGASGWEFDQTTEVAGVGPAFLPLAGSIPEAAPIPAGNSTPVAGVHGSHAAALAAPGLATPLAWNSRLCNAFTIAIWMKMNTIENDKVYFSFGDHRTPGIRQHNGSLNLFALGDWSRDAGPSSMMTSWTHLAAVFSGSRLQIYRNGHLVSAYNATPASFTPFPNLQIGATNGTNGAVRSVHFYDRGFAAAEIRNLHLWGRHGPSGAPLHSPLESWRLHHFGSIENSGAAANTSDPDRDGLANLAEYALGGNPTTAADATRPTLVPDVGSPLVARFAFPRMRADVM
jgi:hypothetical protein